jgi:lipid-binding SYLF domain-containing protein
LNKLYASVHGSHELAGKANGILVFPAVIAAGLVVGGALWRAPIIGFVMTNAGLMANLSLESAKISRLLL